MLYNRKLPPQTPPQFNLLLHWFYSNFQNQTPQITGAGLYGLNALPVMTHKGLTEQRLRPSFPALNAFITRRLAKWMLL